MNDGYQHQCEWMPVGGASIAPAEHFLGDSAWQWCLVITREATEADLEEFQYIEEVGDHIWQTVIGISHCPFCGVTLESDNTKGEPLEAHFHHIDSSNSWYSRRL